MLTAQMSGAKRNCSLRYGGLYITKVLLSHGKATERGGISTQKPQEME